MEVRMAKKKHVEAFDLITQTTVAEFDTAGDAYEVLKRKARKIVEETFRSEVYGISSFYGSLEFSHYEIPEGLEKHIALWISANVGDMTLVLVPIVRRD